MTFFWQPILLLLGSFLMLVIGIAELLNMELGGLSMIVGSFSLGFANWLISLRRHDQQRLKDAIQSLERLNQGQAHHFLPEGIDRIGELGRRINQLQDEVRKTRLSHREEQILDQAMTRESPNGLMVVSADGKIKRANPAMFRLIPPNKEAHGQRVREVFPLTELADVIEEASQTRAIAERAVLFLRRDLLLRGVPLADGVGCLGVVLDVTSVRIAERARRDFVANVSHELRTPITAILGYAEALNDESELLPDHIPPMLAAIERNARRLSALVEDVLQLSKLDAWTGDLPLEREGLSGLVEEVLDRLSARQKDAGIRVLCRVPDGLEAMVNPDAFLHALGNLVDNALKYTPVGGRVEVFAVAAGERVKVEVRDSGPGIAAEHLERIFERFYRVDAGRSRAVGGTGLGLALVKHLCRVSRAEVTVQSVVGEGSVFTLWLPR